MNFNNIPGIFLNFINLISPWDVSRPFLQHFLKNRGKILNKYLFLHPINLYSDLLTAQDVWDEEAVYPLHIQLNLHKDEFTLTDREHLRLKPDEQLYLRFDGTHKMWYSMNDPDEIIIPSMESAQFSTKELKSVAFTHVSPKGPKEHSMKIPQLLEVRLKHGIFFTVDVEQKQVTNEVLIKQQSLYNS